MTDLIDRKNLLGFIEFDKDLTGEEPTASDIIMMIKTAPTVEAVRHGKWTRTTGYGWLCTACNMKTITDSEMYEPEFDFCPQCGADMTGGYATAELVQHGKWIDISGPDENDNINCKCSLCGAGETHSKSMIVPYCWKCGARMDGENNG